VESSSLDIGRLILSTLGFRRASSGMSTTGRDTIAATPSIAVRSASGSGSSRDELRRGAERTIAWYSQNRPWWEKVKSGAFREYYEKAYRL